MSKQPDNAPREMWDTMRALTLLIKQIDKQLNGPTLGTPYMVIRRKGKIPVTLSSDCDGEWMLTETMNPSMEGVVCFNEEDAQELVSKLDPKDEPYAVSVGKYLKNWRSRLVKARLMVGKIYAAAKEMEVHLDYCEWGACIAIHDGSNELRDQVRSLKL